MLLSRRQCEYSNWLIWAQKCVCVCGVWHRPEIHNVSVRCVFKVRRQGKRHLKKIIKQPFSVSKRLRLCIDNLDHYHSVETSIKNILLFSCCCCCLFCFRVFFPFLVCVFFYYEFWNDFLSLAFPRNQTMKFTGYKLNLFVWLEGKWWIFKDIHIHPTFSTILPLSHVIIWITPNHKYYCSFQREIKAL